MKRPRKGLDCFRALRVSDALIYGGFACTLLGCGVGYWDGAGGGGVCRFAGRLGPGAAVRGLSPLRGAPL